MWSYHPSVGVPQGCALSAYLCNVLVSGWADRIGEMGRCQKPISTIERYMLGRPERLGGGVDSESALGRRAMVGPLTARKPTLHACPPIWTSDLPFPDGTGGPETEKSVTTLGHEIPFTYKQAIVLQKKETMHTALRTCQRLEVMKLNPKSAQQVVASVVLKQFAYGLQARPIPVKHCSLFLGRRSRKATHVRARRHAWPALADLSCKPQRTWTLKRPPCMCTIVNLLRALRKGGEAQRDLETAQARVPARQRPPRPERCHVPVPAQT